MFLTSHPNIWVFLGNICKLIDNYSIKLNQTDNGLVILHKKRPKYVANDKRIKSARRQLRQGLISLGTFLKRYSVAGYEERMRALAIGQIYNEAVENQVPQLLDIPNGEVLNHMDDEAVENQVRPEKINIFDVSDDEVVDLDQETAADMSGYHHETVNHSEFFYDPTTGAQTQTIECIWRHVKTKYGITTRGAMDLLDRKLIEEWWWSINIQHDLLEFSGMM